MAHHWTVDGSLRMDNIRVADAAVKPASSDGMPIGNSDGISRGTPNADTLLVAT